MLNMTMLQKLDMNVLRPHFTNSGHWWIWDGNKQQLQVLGVLASGVAAIQNKTVEII